MTRGYVILPTFWFHHRQPCPAWKRREGWIHSTIYWSLKQKKTPTYYWKHSVRNYFNVMPKFSKSRRNPKPIIDLNRSTIMGLPKATHFGFDLSEYPHPKFVSYKYISLQVKIMARARLELYLHHWHLGSDCSWCRMESLLRTQWYMNTIFG